MQGHNSSDTLVMYNCSKCKVKIENLKWWYKGYVSHKILHICSKLYKVNATTIRIAPYRLLMIVSEAPCLWFHQEYQIPFKLLSSKSFWNNLLIVFSMWWGWVLNKAYQIVRDVEVLVSSFGKTGINKKFSDFEIRKKNKVNGIDNQFWCSFIY